MSRTVDMERPFNAEEKAYLRTRSGGEELIRINERKFNVPKREAESLRTQAIEDDEEEARRRREAEEAAKQEEEDSFDDEDVAQVAPLTVKQLRERLKKLEMDTEGNKEELQLRLLEHLDRQRNPESYEE